MISMLFRETQDVPNAYDIARGRADESGNCGRSGPDQSEAKILNVGPL